MDCPKFTYQTRRNNPLVDKGLIHIFNWGHIFLLVSTSELQSRRKKMSDRSSESEATLATGVTTTQA